MVNTSAIAGLLFFTAALTAGLALLAFRYRSEPGAEWFTGVAAIGALLIVMDTLHLVGSTWLVLFVVEWAGTVLYITVPVVWFCFILSYVGYGELLTWRRRLLLFSVPAVSTVSLATMQYNDLYWAFEISRQAGRVTFVTEPGPLAFLALLYSYTLFMAGLVLVVGMLRRGGSLFSGQAVWILVGTVAPMIGGLLTAFGPDLEQVLPPFPIGLSVFTLAFGYGLFRHRIFDLTPATRNLGTTTAVQSLNEGIVVLNTDGTVVSINDGACQLFGCDRGSALGASIEEVHPELQGIEDRPQPVDVTDDGSSFEVTTSTVEEVRGREIGQAVVVRDVTAQRDRKQRLSVLNRVLRHDLRNDISVIDGYLRLLREELGDCDSAAVTDALDVLSARTDGMTEVTEQAALAESLADGDPDVREFDLAAVVRRRLDQARTEHPEVRLDATVPESAVTIAAVSVLPSAVDNLIENAIEHSDRERPRLSVTLDGDAGDGVAELRVADDGPGLPADDRAVLVDVEPSLDDANGLGLWLINRIVRTSGGSVSVEDATEGTAITVRLPLVDPSRGSPSERSSVRPT